jgi:hypothetical protein
MADTYAFLARQHVAESVTNVTESEAVARSCMLVRSVIVFESVAVTIC